MLIRTRMGVSTDGFIATPDGLPAFLAIRGFVPTAPTTGPPSTSNTRQPS